MRKYVNPPETILKPQSYIEDDEIDLRDLFIALWKGKWIIIIMTVIFAVGSIIFALRQPNIYKSETLLASSDSANNGGRLAQMAAQYGGLASLARINIGGGQLSKAKLAVQVLQSRQFIGEFIKKHHLLVPLMASKGWDLSSNRLILNDKIYDSQRRIWLRKPSALRGAEPSDQEAYNKFKGNVLGITLDKESNLYTISISFYSPYLAQQWVNWLVQDINEVMRDRTIAETSQNLNYLEEQLSKTSVADMQSTFYRLIEEQMKQLMLAEVQNEFVFKVVDPAVVPEVKDKPKRALICIVGSMLGCMFGIIIIFVRYSFGRSK